MESQHRGTASGFACMFVKLPSFLAVFLVPSLFGAIGKANATLFVALYRVASGDLHPAGNGYRSD